MWETTRSPNTNIQVISIVILLRKNISLFQKLQSNRNLIKSFTHSEVTPSFVLVTLMEHWVSLFSMTQNNQSMNVKVLTRIVQRTKGLTVPCDVPAVPPRPPRAVGLDTTGLRLQIPRDNHLFTFIFVFKSQYYKKKYKLFGKIQFGFFFLCRYYS